MNIFSHKEKVSCLGQKQRKAKAMDQGHHKSHCLLFCHFGLDLRTDDKQVGISLQPL